MKFIGNFEKRVEINRTAKNLAGYKNAYSHLERFIRSQYKVSDFPWPMTKHGGYGVHGEIQE